MAACSAGSVAAAAENATKPRETITAARKRAFTSVGTGEFS
jgi:hypothetical protein